MNIQEFRPKKIAPSRKSSNCSNHSEEENKNPSTPNMAKKPANKNQQKGRTYKRNDNRKIIRRAIENVCLAGKVNAKQREILVKSLNEYEGDNDSHNYIVVLNDRNAKLVI